MHSACVAHPFFNLGVFIFVHHPVELPGCRPICIKDLKEVLRYKALFTSPVRLENLDHLTATEVAQRTLTVQYGMTCVCACSFPMYLRENLLRVYKLPTLVSPSRQACEVAFGTSLSE